MTNYDQFLGPYGVVIGCLAIVGTLCLTVIPFLWWIFWRSNSAQMVDMRFQINALTTGLARCEERDKIRDDEMRALDRQAGVMEGKLLVLETLNKDRMQDAATIASAVAVAAAEAAAKVAAVAVKTAAEVALHSHP